MSTSTIVVQFCTQRRKLEYHFEIHNTNVHPCWRKIETYIVERLYTRTMNYRFFFVAMGTVRDFAESRRSHPALSQPQLSSLHRENVSSSSFLHNETCPTKKLPVATNRANKHANSNKRATINSNRLTNA